MRPNTPTVAKTTVNPAIANDYRRGLTSSQEETLMDAPPSITDLADDELREVCLVAVFLLAQANWVNGVDDDMWRDVLDEAYRRGWTDRRVKIEGESLN